MTEVDPSSSINQSSSILNPQFDHITFEQKLANGWLKKYLYSLILFFLGNIAYIINNWRLGVHYLKDPILTIPEDEDSIQYYCIVLYGVTLMILGAVTLLFILGIFFQYQAIRLRSLGRQDSCLEVITIFILVQTCGASLNIMSAILIKSMSMVTATLIGILSLVIAIVFKFLASNVKNIMTGKEEESFKINKSTFQV